MDFFLLAIGSIGCILMICVIIAQSFQKIIMLAILLIWKTFWDGAWGLQLTRKCSGASTHDLLKQKSKSFGSHWVQLQMKWFWFFFPCQSSLRRKKPKFSMYLCYRYADAGMLSCPQAWCWCAHSWPIKNCYFRQISSGVSRTLLWHFDTCMDGKYLHHWCYLKVNAM